MTSSCKIIAYKETYQMFFISVDGIPIRFAFIPNNRSIPFVFLQFSFHPPFLEKIVPACKD